MNKKIQMILLTISFMVIAFRAVRAAGSSSLYAMFSTALSKAFGMLNSTQYNSVASIISSFDKFGDGDLNKLAYILATAFHESKLAPVREIRAQKNTALYVRQEAYWPSGYYGRGFVQLTWHKNYKAMGEIFNVDLLNNPDLALEPTLAADILVYGMMNGSFTGRILHTYINPTNLNFLDARRVVNGLDQAQLIADYATLIKSNIESIAA